MSTSYLTASQTAERLGVSRMTVNRLIRSGALSAIRPGRNYVLEAQVVEQYLEAHRVAVPA
jgi:excisionase family DNA binding protein